MRRSFVLYSEYAEHMEYLSLEQRGTLFTAIMNYANDNELPDMDGAVKMAFSFIKKQLDRDSDKYEETVEKRRNAGRASGVARKNKAEQKRTKRTSVKCVQQTRTKRTDNVDVDVYVDDDVNENVNDNDGNTPLNPPKGEKKLSASSLIEEREYGSVLEEAVKDWVQYKTEKNQRYKPTGLKSLLTEIQNNANEHGDAAVVDVIHKSMAAGYTGITWAWLGKPVARSGTPVRRDGLEDFLNGG